MVPRPAVREISHSPASARLSRGHRYVGCRENAGREIYSYVQECAEAVPQREQGTKSWSEPLPRELNLQGEVVAIVVAETEDLAQDAADAIKVDLRNAALRFPAEGQHGAGRARSGPRKRQPDPPFVFARTIFRMQRGPINAATSTQDSRKRTSSRNSPTGLHGGVSVPMQPSGSVAKWDGDKLTMWGMGQGIYPVRASLAAALGMDVSKVRLINKWNGSHVRRGAHGRREILSDDRPCWRKSPAGP